jgi:hypothetical protein
VAEADVQALNAALARKGPNRLLWVRQAQTPAAAGQVRCGDDGLLLAEIDVLAAYDQGMSHPSRMWLPILQKARRLAEFDTLARAA